MTIYPRIIFCESLSALDDLYKRGLPKNTRVLSRAPSLLNTNNNYIVNIDNNINNKEKHEIRKKFKELTEKFYLNIKDLLDDEYTILLTTRFFNYLFDVYNGILIKDEYLNENFGFVELKVNQREIGALVNNNLQVILNKSSNYIPLRVSATVTDERSLRGESKTSLKNRFRIVGLKGLIWLLLNYLSKYKFWHKKSEIGVLFYNELVRDIVTKLFTKNFKSIAIFNSPYRESKKKLNNNSKDIRIIIDRTRVIIDEALLNIESKKVKNILSILWDESVKDEINKYKSYVNQSELFLKDKKYLKYIITGYINSTKAAALYNTCKNKDISLIVCQHGVSRELLQDPYMNSIKFETSFCDHFLCFNILSKKITEQSKFLGNNKKITVVGLPNDYFRVVKRNIIFKKPILYVSTVLLSGGRPNILAGESDSQMVKWEKNLVNTVFSKLKSKVDFKPYPSVRYQDPDLVLSDVRKIKNINIVGAHMDLRYIISNYKIIITSGATSTLSWCVNTNVPIIFINRKGPLSLSKSALKHLSNIIFIFDQNETSWDVDLFNFLNQPYNVIKNKWSSKKDNKKEILDNLFGTKLNIKDLSFN